MNKPPVVLLYGLDEANLPYEVSATIALVSAAGEALHSRGWRVENVRLEHDIVTPLKHYDPKEWIVLNLCEGSPTQDFYYARVAHVLGALGYTFTGSDHHALDQTQHKTQMKALLRDSNVPTPAWATYTSVDEVDFSVYPAIVKPASEHCSLGITRDSVVLCADEARHRVDQVVRTYNGPALVEEFLDSAEYNVTVWGCHAGEESNVSVLGISTMTYDAFSDIHDRLCTFEAKWEPASKAYQLIPAICPAPVSTDLQAEIERVAVAAYRAVGCRDYGRVDMRMRDGVPMALDVNANCDVSPDSGFANTAHAAGLTYAEMIEQIVMYAVQRRDTSNARMNSRYMTEGVRLMSIPAVA